MTATTYEPEPGTQAHYDALLDYRRRVDAGEIPMPVTTLANTAEHEAAHATVAVLLGIRFDELVLMPVREWREGEPAGWSNAKVRGTDREDTLIRGCASLWAGAIVDGHLYGAGGYLRGSRHNDLQQIVAGSALLPEAKQGIPFSVAADLVTRHRAVIDVMAARLIEAGRLSFAECVAIVRAEARPGR